MSQPQSARYQRSAGGLVGALLVMVVLITAWVGFRALTSDHPSDPVHTVNYSQEVPALRKAAGFPLVAPPRLPAGWRATTVSFVPGVRSHWHLGVLTQHGRYVGLEQGPEPVRSMLETYVDDSPARGEPVSVAGRTWATYTDSGGDLALVRRTAGTTTLVVGHDVDRATLTSYAASLR